MIRGLLATLLAARDPGLRPGRALRAGGGKHLRLRRRRRWPHGAESGPERHLGLVVTPQGAVFIDSGATWQTRLIGGADARLELGGTVFELRHRGGGHTPGDMMAWLPQAKLLFAGDIAYVDRLLAVISVSNTRSWLDAFAVIEALAPTKIVPGHGRVTDLANAGAQTQTYLVALRERMMRAVDKGLDPSAAARSFDGKAWARWSTPPS